MNESDVARRFGRIAGEAAAAEHWPRAQSEKDSFRAWCDLIAPMPILGELRFELERTFEETYQTAFWLKQGTPKGVRTH